MKRFTLRNGIPVICEHMPGTQAVTALILFKVGSRNETKKINGVSHFVEHLFFKGTERRPTSLELTKELDGVGADFNAFTGKDYTGYYIKVSNRHTDLAVDILEDLLFHPIFDPEEIDRERGVIVEEINMYEDSPMRTSEEFSEQLMYGANHPLGYLIAGPKENILNVSRNKIIQYRDTYYHSGNMIIVLAGNLSKNVPQILREKFGAAPKAPKSTPKPKRFTFTQKSPRLYVHRKKTSQAHLALTFPAPSYDSPDLPVAKLLSIILGGGMSSRLFINVRERQGLCYYISSHVSPYTDVGSFTIQAGFDIKRINLAVQAIIKEITAMRDHGITEEELTKAKEYIRGKMSIRLEDSENVADWWGTQALHHDTLYTPAQYEKQILSITAQQINRYAKKMFLSAKANMAIIGPYTKKQEDTFKTYLKF